jgi:hypothetical protein
MARTTETTTVLVPTMAVKAACERGIAWAVEKWEEDREEWFREVTTPTPRWGPWGVFGGKAIFASREEAEAALPDIRLGWMRGPLPWWHWNGPHKAFYERLKSMIELAPDSQTVALSVSDMARFKPEWFD